MARWAAEGTLGSRSESRTDRERTGSIARVPSVWTRVVGDKPLHRRRVTRYGLGFYAWLPTLLFGLGLTVLGIGYLVSGPRSWDTLGYVGLGLVSLTVSWIVMTTEPPDS